MKHVSLPDPEADSDAAWYLVQLKPGGLARAQANLTRQGFVCFMPLRPETRRRAGRLQTLDRPLFPGYLFVRVARGSAPWRKINNTYGVARLVSLSGHAPSVVPAPLISALIAASREGCWMPETAALTVGTPVALVNGPFAGALARIEAAPKDGRVLVLMEMMGQAVRTAVPVQALQPTPTASA